MTSNYYSNRQDSSVKVNGDVNNSTIKTGNNYRSDSPELKTTVKEIEELIKKLSSNYSDLDTIKNMEIATQVIKKIESNPSWKQKAISAARSGLLTAIKTNPVGEIIVAVIEGWSKK